MAPPLQWKPEGAPCAAPCLELLQNNPFSRAPAGETILKGFFDWCHYNFWSSAICHYNSPNPKHAITIPSFTEPRHFLRIPRHRAHPQAYAYGRTPVVDAFAPPLASIGAGSPLPPLARSHSLPSASPLPPRRRRRNPNPSPPEH